MQNRLYVGNLAMDVTHSSLEELFEPYGFVMDVKLLSGTDAAKLRAALVTMAIDESAKAAIVALNGIDLHGLAITVQAARERPQ